MNLLNITRIKVFAFVFTIFIFFSCTEPEADNGGAGGGVSGNTINFELAIPKMVTTPIHHLTTSKNGQHIYLSTGVNTNPDWFYSSDGGDSWAEYQLTDYNQPYSVGNDGTLLARANNKLYRVKNGSETLIEGNIRSNHQAVLTVNNQIVVAGDNGWRIIPNDSTDAPVLQRFGTTAVLGWLVGLSKNNEAIFQTNDSLIFYHLSNKTWETKYFPITTEARNFTNEGVSNLSRFTQLTYHLDDHYYLVGIKGFIKYNSNFVEQERSHWPNNKTLQSTSVAATTTHIYVDGGGNLFTGGLSQIYGLNFRNMLYQYSGGSWKVLVGPESYLQTLPIATHSNGTYRVGHDPNKPVMGMVKTNTSGQLTGVTSIENKDYVEYKWVFPVNETKMLVSANHYLYEYTVGTDNWRFIDSLTFDYIGQLENGNLIATGMHAPLNRKSHYKSTDEGQTWQPISNEFEEGKPFDDYFTVNINDHPTLGYVMVACSAYARFIPRVGVTATDYIYKHFTSTDGENWSEWNFTTSGVFFDHITAIDNNGKIFGIYMGEFNPFGQYDPDVASRSDDGGNTWKEIGEYAPYSINANNTLLSPKVSSFYQFNEVVLFKQGWDSWQKFETKFPATEGGRIEFDPKVSFESYQGFFGPNNVIYYNLGQEVYRSTGSVN